MEVRDIERALFQFGRLADQTAMEEYPLLSARLERVAPSAHLPTRAMQMFNLMRDLREEMVDRPLVEEAQRLIAREPAR